MEAPAVREAGGASRSPGTAPARRPEGRAVAEAVARWGLVARAAFYLVLAYLTADLATTGSTTRQDNAHGALAAVASHLLGKAAILSAAAGFAAFGAVRVAAAARDHRAGGWRRFLTLCQGVFYLCLTWVPLSFVFGNSSAGSEQQQHSEAAGLLHLPAGRELVAAVGVVFIGVCALQIRTALTQGWYDGMDTDGRPRWVRALVRGAGTVGIAARAAVFLPIGVFLIIAAFQYDAAHADGLDRELAGLVHQEWGAPVLGLVAAGLVVFAVYSLLEARYRSLSRGD